MRFDEKGPEGNESAIKVLLSTKKDLEGFPSCSSRMDISSSETESDDIYISEAEMNSDSLISEDEAEAQKSFCIFKSHENPLPKKSFFGLLNRFFPYFKNVHKKILYKMNK